MASPGPEPKSNDAPAPRKSGAPPYTWWIGAAVLLILAALFFALDTTKSLSLTEFERLYRDGKVKRFVINGKEAWGELRDQNDPVAKEFKLSGGKFAITLPAMNNQKDFLDEISKADSVAREKLGAQNQEIPPPIEVRINNEPPQFLAPLILSALLFLGFIAFFVFFVLPRIRDPNGGSFASGFGRSGAKRFEKGKNRFAFDDVAGMETAKKELQELVDFLRNPDKFTRLGAQVPKGVLLIGPPGTGKTLLARAVAGEANVPFFTINGSEFIQMFVGVGASRVRDLFRTAKDSCPCVIFIDEIDAVGRMRGAGVGGGSDEREQTLNQILSEMDGFQQSETVIVLAATNRPDVLDAALLRPGRFDRHVTVDKPTWQGRKAILIVHTKNKPLADDVDLERIARAMIGMSGADLKNLANEAALHATRLGKNKIDQTDFDAASDRVRLGLKRDDLYGDEEKRRTAYHEAGHALCAYLEPKADPLERISIVPRGRTGGVTIFAPDEDRIDLSASEYIARLVTLMGGRAADRIVFGEAQSGAIQDIKMATRIARAMVTQFGMSDRLGPVHYKQSEEHVFLGKEIVESREFSEGTARIIDEEIQRLLTDAERRAMELLTVNRHDLDKLAGALLVREELDRDDVHLLLRKSVPEASAETRVSGGGETTATAFAFGGT